VDELGDMRALEGHKTVFEVLVENPHNKPVKWFKDGKEVKPEGR